MPRRAAAARPLTIVTGVVQMLRLDGGDRVVAFTDGLVESSTRDMSLGLDKLAGLGTDTDVLEVVTPAQAGDEAASGE